MNEIMSTIIRGAFRTGLKIAKYSPQLCVAGGIIFGAVAIYETITATLEAPKVLEKATEDKKIIDETKAEHDSYTDDNYKRDLMVVRKDTALGLAKLYWKAALCFLLSTGLYLKGYSIINARYVSTLAILKLTQDALEKTREELRERDAIIGEAVNDIPPDNETKEMAVHAVSKNPNDISVYAKFFDCGNPQWSNTPEYNLLFLKAKQSYWNDVLHAKGHVFLNEVYKDIGIPETQAGQVVGWILGGDGDNFVDFGIYDVLSGKNRDFVNGVEPSILLDFNVNGIIYDLI